MLERRVVRRVLFELTPIAAMVAAPGLHRGEADMKILFADAVDERRLERLRSEGHECVVEPTLTAESLPEAIGDAEALVVRSTKVTAETIAAASSLGLVVRAGAGTDNIDKAAAAGHGVYVCNVPGKNAIAVAELTLGLILTLDRNIADNVIDIRQGVWDKSRYTKAEGLAGKHLAIVGLGEIGLAVAERAKGFGLTVTAVRKDDRSASVLQRIRQIGIRLVDDLPTLLAEADIVTVHVPKSEATTGLVDQSFLGQMRDGAFLINTSRGEVVDEEALLDALTNRGMKAGLDVYANEPGASQGTFDSKLAQHPSVAGTHHIGASTEQAQAAVADGTIEVIEHYAAGDVINCVNLVGDPVGTDCIVIRHQDRVGVLAQVFAVLRSSGLNVQQMSNQVFAHGGAAVATIHIGGSELLSARSDVIAELSAIDEVISASFSEAN